jgi:two-component system sensor histidine kinase AlgZ
MHPLLKSRAGLASYLMAWLPLSLLFGIVIGSAADLRWTETVLVTAPAVVLLMFVCLSPWYSCRSLPLRSTPQWKLVLNHTVAAMCASALVVLFAKGFLALAGGFSPNLLLRSRSAIPVIAGTVLLIYLLSVALHYAMLAIESSRKAELLSRESELRALKSQVNPHFLFNSLNSISALTTADPKRAREMCIKLSEFLRTSLRLGERASIPFSEELALARTYLDVEQVRFGRRLRIRQQIDDACGSCEIPPLLVQPLIENAIKHGIATLIEGGEIALQSARDHNSMRIVVENPFDPDAPATAKSGFGLVNVRNRLLTRYGKAARLEVQIERSRYRVTLVFPIEYAREREMV